MKQRILITAGICVLLIAGILIVWHRGGSVQSAPGTSAADNPSNSSIIGSSVSTTNHPGASAPGTSPAISASNRPSATPIPLGQIPQTSRAPLPPGPPPPGGLNAVALQDLQKINLMLRDYRTAMGQNPVGTNAEIMQSIMGGNAKKARIGPPDGVSLNGNGELVDPWGTPFFFHQLSGTQMEVRSAGPDRIMWTGDDIIQK